MSRKLEDLVGKVFGKLTVKEYAGLLAVGKTRASAWTCVCDCGNEVVVLNNNLRRHNTKSCGCLHIEIVRQIKTDLSNNKFGLLTVLKFLRTNSGGNSVWLCICECGKTCEAVSCALQNGDKKSCGCKQGWWRSAKPGLWKNTAEYAKWQRQDPIRKVRHAVSASVRRMLRYNGSYKRKKSIRSYLPYTIDELKLHLETKWEEWMNWDNYGGKSNDTRKTWHIDHIIPHSSYAYTSMDDPKFLECWALTNLRPLEKKANMSKGAKNENYQRQNSRDVFRRSYRGRAGLSI